MDDRSDGNLLTAWKGGDSQAFEALVHRHQGPLLRHARAWMNDWRSCEDVVQEAFLRLAQKPPSLPSPSTTDPGAERAIVASWLHRVTRNLCLDATRSEQRASPGYCGGPRL